MDERSTRERRNKLLILLLSVGIVVCLAITIWALFFRRPAPAPEPDYAAPELEQNAEPAKDSGTKLDIPAGGGGINRKIHATKFMLLFCTVCISAEQGPPHSSRPRVS